jgi:hypothetical protein
MEHIFIKEHSDLFPLKKKSLLLVKLISHEINFKEKNEI